MIINQNVSGGSSSDKYGVNLSGWIGDLDNSGEPAIRTDQAVGILSIPNLVLVNRGDFRFSNSNGLVGTVNLPAVVGLMGAYCMEQAFLATGITGLNMGSIQNNIPYKGLESFCSECSELTTVNIGGTNIERDSNNGFGVGPFGLYGAFNGTGITTLVVNISSFETDDEFLDQTGQLMQMCNNCLSLTDIYFPMLEGYQCAFDVMNLSGGDFESGMSACCGNMLDGCSGVTVHFCDDFASEVMRGSEDMGYTISSEQDVTDALLATLGGTNTTISFDISYE